MIVYERYAGIRKKDKKCDAISDGTNSKRIATTGRTGSTNRE